ncbi:MAG: ATP-binding protein [Campylobacterales bacterium]|nr:ATP-binding protein [Campylobacterales bacterium]
MSQQSNLIFFTGKMGAGKSTKSQQIALEKGAVLLSEDEWLSALYPNEIHSFDDYIRYSLRMKPLIHGLVKNILQTGSDVVMDFPANTQRQRKWFLDLALEADVNHQLIYLKMSDEICLKQISQRRTEQPQRAKFDTESVFYETMKYFEEPHEDELLNIELIERK